jgi:glyoxylase-like metal-dependent hydrolase (beta-lactamase superfamily II)
MTTDASRYGWEKPGAHEVSPGVFRIPLPLPQDGLHAVNVYALLNGGRLTMIDAGWALEESRRRLEGSLALLGHDLGDVDRFLVTHAHRDHYTQALSIRRRFGTRVGIGIEESHTLRYIQAHPQEAFPAAMLTEVRVHGGGELVNLVLAGADLFDPVDLDDWQDPDEWIPAGARLELGSRTLYAISTPGHTRGHLAFHDPDAGLLFSGDHLLPHITPSIGFEALPSAFPLAEYLRSLAHVLSMPDAVMLPAHGPPGGSTHARSQALTDHHRDRLDAVERAVAAGADTGYAVTRQLPWTSRKKALDDLDVLSRLLAVHETVAHLMVLVEDGRLRIHNDGAMRHFTA